MSTEVDLWEPPTPETPQEKYIKALENQVMDLKEMLREAEINMGNRWGLTQGHKRRISVALEKCVKKP